MLHYWANLLHYWASPGYHTKTSLLIDLNILMAYVRMWLDRGKMFGFLMFAFWCSPYVKGTSYPTGSRNYLQPECLAYLSSSMALICLSCSLLPTSVLTSQLLLARCSLVTFSSFQSIWLQKQRVEATTSNSPWKKIFLQRKSSKPVFNEIFISVFLIQCMGYMMLNWRGEFLNKWMHCIIAVLNKQRVPFLYNTNKQRRFFRK